ncbi:MAG: DUF4367 domain-containing protein [Oscillospiraceae bacterium]|jgi:hypothetical protein|nr:DUF4367 domain-containing protein [Oscillospiraceae bacterium]
MLTDNENARNKVFDLVLTEALKECCEQEIRSFEDGDGEEHIFGEKFESGIKSVQKRLKQKQNAAKLKKLVPRLAASAAVLTAFAALAGNPYINPFLRDGGGGTSVIINSDIERRMPSYVPEGFELSQAYSSEEYGYALIDFVDSNGNVINISSNANMGGDFYNDPLTETATVNGNIATLYEDSGGKVLSWYDNTGYLNRVYAPGVVEWDELIKIAESIKAGNE